VDDNAGPSEIRHAPQDYLQSDVEDGERLIVPEVPPESDEDEEIVGGEDISQQPKKLKAPAWTDPDDVNVQVSLASNNRLRKLRDAPSDDTVGGREYERRLRRQFERINPTPDWASNARKKGGRAKRRRSSVSGSESGEDVVPELLASTGRILGTAKSRPILPSTLSIERLRDANQAAPAEGEIKTVAFHPSPHVPVLLTASADRRLRLFHVSVTPDICALEPDLSSVDRWSHESSCPNSPRTITSHFQCRFPSQRHVHINNWPTTFLLHLRSSVWHLPSLSSGPMGHYILVGSCGPRHHGDFFLQPNRGHPRCCGATRPSPPCRLEIRCSAGRGGTQGKLKHQVSVVVEGRRRRAPGFDG
jgi:hypothetical protein